MQGDSYWHLKNGSPITITTGFRIWPDQTSTAPSRKSETSFDYTFFDFGIEEIIPPVVIEEVECVEPDCEAEGGLGDFYGMSLETLIIAAILLVMIIILVVVCCCCFKSKPVTGGGDRFTFGKEANAAPVTVGKRAASSKEAAPEESKQLELADSKV